MHELHNLFYSLGFVSESNEYAYSNGTYRILKLLDVYDPAWIEKENIENKTMNTHSEHAKELAQDIIQYLLCHEGQAECFPTMKWKS